MAKASESSIVTKCALVIDILAAARAPLTFSQIVDRTGFVKSSCHRILSVLAGERLVEYDKASRTYRTGDRLSTWSRLAWRRVDLQEIAGVEMIRLSDELRTNVALSVLDGDTILYLRTVDYVPIRYAATMGDHAPLHCTAAGKVFLAHMPEGRRAETLAQMTFDQMTEHTITSPQRLEVEFPAVRDAGYALAAREEFLNVYGIAAPIWGEDGAVAACLAMWLVSSSADGGAELVAHADRLKDATSAISKALGWAGPSMQA